MSTSNKNDNMVSPVKKPLKKNNTGKKNTKKKVVSATNVKSPIVKGTVVKKNTTKSNDKTVIKTVNSTKPATKNRVNVNTNKKNSVVASNVKKNTAKAVKTETKAVTSSKAIKSTTKGVKSPATYNASSKKGKTGTTVTKANDTKTKGVAKAASDVKTNDLPKVKKVIKTEEDLNKEIDKYISNAGIPTVNTNGSRVENNIESIENIVEDDYSRTREYKDLAAELREQAEKEAREQYERELSLSKTTLVKIEDEVENKLNENVNNDNVSLDDIIDENDHVVTGETIDLSSLPSSLDDTSSYQNIDEALKYEVKNNTPGKEKKKKSVVYSVIKIIFSLVFIIISALFGFTAVHSNYLPTKYSIILIVVLVLINLFTIFLLRRKHKIFNVFGFILIILFSVVLGLGYNYMNNTFDVIKDILKEDEVYSEYYYVVLKDSQYNTPADLSNSNLGLVNTNKDNVVKKVNEEINVNYREFDTVGNMLYGLSLHEVEGVIISSTTYDLMKENDENFEDTVKVIGTVSIVGEVNTVESKIDVNKSFVVYISGVDTRDTSSVPVYGLSDVNLLAVVNPTSHRILLVNIPRDYYVKLHGIESGYRDKLTHAGLYGVEMSMNTLADLFNIEINTYVRVNFATVTTLVDDIDGIDVYSDKSFNSYHMSGWVVPQGTSHMNGAKALAFARERYAYASGDRHRGENQQAVITAIINKLSSNKKYLLQYDKILSDISPYFATNIKEQNIQELVKDQLNTMPSWTVESVSVDGTNSSNYTYSWPTQYTYVMLPNQSTIDNAKAKMADVMKS